MTSPRERFRAILAGTDCAIPGSVFDAPSALIAEHLGFECGILAGSVASLTILGAPDLILLTASEFVEQARRICRASNLPLSVDADHGYGNALNVMRTVADLEAAGVSAMTIEDTLLPRPFNAKKTELISIDEAVGKIRAALAARCDAGLVIAGRTSVAEAASLEETLARVAAYEAAGADAVFLSGVTAMAQIEAVGALVKVPVMLGGLPAGLAAPADLAKLGVRFNIAGHQPYLAALEATYQTMKVIREGGKPGHLLTEERRRIAERREEFKRFSQEFLRKEELLF
jgi:carboxyvinyl-carboxyphosphonate phosphorylmutase